MKLSICHSYCKSSILERERKLKYYNRICPWKSFIFILGDSLKKGESTLSLSPNQAPTNGTCDLSPETGETLKTYFSYSCQGWKDDHNVQNPLIYRLVVINADQSSDILYRGIQSKRSFQLPIGEKNNNRELQIQILVEDTLGAVAIGLRK